MKKHSGFMIEKDGYVLGYVFETHKEAYNYMKRLPTFSMVGYVLGKIKIKDHQFRILEVLIKVKKK